MTTTRDQQAEAFLAPALPDRWQVLDGLADSRRTAHDAHVAEVELAARWALMHPAPARDEDSAVAQHDDRTWAAEPGQPTLAGDTTVFLAGPGAPGMAEFALAELSATLVISHVAARRLVGEALELVHRLPRVWAHARVGRLPVWRARAIAGLTVDLSPDAVAHADRLLAATPARISTVHAHRLVDEARLYADPDRAAEDERIHLDGRGVWLNPATTPAVTGVHMLLDTRDAHLLDQTLDRVAHDLRALGDTDTRDIRRATAVRILADPQHALDLMTGSTYGYGHPGPADPANRVDQDSAGGAGRVRKQAPGHTLYLHLTLAELVAATSGPAAGVGVGVGVMERLGPATTDLIAAWLTSIGGPGSRASHPGRRTSGRSGGAPSLTVRPVLDLASDRAVDRHDPPPLLREQVLLRDAHCVFPGCHRDSRACDLDHVEPYLALGHDGAPGQTRPSNLAPLCRTHHRVKTHGGWTYRRTADDAWEWASPTGRTHVVRPASRRPPAPPAERGTWLPGPPHRDVRHLPNTWVTAPPWARPSAPDLN